MMLWVVLSNVGNHMDFVFHSHYSSMGWVDGVDFNCDVGSMGNI